MRKIYTFSLTQEIEKDKVETSTDEAGAKIEKTTKVKEPVTKKYFFARPNRSLHESAELFGAQKESEYLRAGILSMAQIQKKVFDDNTLLSEEQKKNYQNLREQWVKLQAEYLAITDKKKEESERTDEEKSKIEEILKKLTGLAEKMQPFEDINSAYNSLYNNTAEVLARNQIARYLMLFCAYEDTESGPKLLFGDGKYEDKLGQYDKFEEDEDRYIYGLITRFMFISNFYYMNKAESQEDYDLLIKLQEASGVIPKNP